MVLNAAFNNISAISWRLALFIEETEVPGENHQSAVSHRHLAMGHLLSLTSTYFAADVLSMLVKTPKVIQKHEEFEDTKMIIKIRY